MDSIDPTRVEHRWELQAIDDGKPSMGKIKVWVCRNCGARVKPLESQMKSNSFGKPSRKRKVDGFYCGELIVQQIHES